MKISIERRAQVVVLKEEGYTHKEIAHRLGIHFKSVAYILKKHRQTGSVRDRRRAGRPRKSTKRGDNRLRRVAIINPWLTSYDIRREYLDLGLSARTIRRRLCNDFKLPSRRAAKKPLLSKKNIADRIAFCKKYRKWSARQWEKVMFSDESTFSLFAIGRRLVRRPSGMRYDVKYVSPSVKHPPSCMVWGGFSAFSKGPLHFLQSGQTMNGEKYLKVLKIKLKLHMRLLKCKTFQQDGAPCHRAKQVKEWLQQQRIEVLDWPGNSPDLNPIENLWNILKRRVAIRRPKNLGELQNAIRSAWTYDITHELCQKLVHSMPKRVELVLKNKGQSIRY